VRRLLTAVVLVECVLLLGGAVVLGLFSDQLKRPPPTAPAFRPPIYEAVIGDSVRYRRVDPKDEGRDLGYVDLVVRDARIVQHSGLGAEFNVSMSARDVDGKEQHRIIRIQPRLLEHGFLPPSFAEYRMLDVPGGRPVIRSIRTGEVPGGAGFIIETVTPRISMDEVSERIFMRPDVPVFGVVRWERPGEVWILHRSNREKRRDVKEIE
jgi:hypothetical protein